MNITYIQDLAICSVKINFEWGGRRMAMHYLFHLLPLYECGSVIAPIICNTLYSHRALLRSRLALLRHQQFVKRIIMDTIINATLPHNAKKSEIGTRWHHLQSSPPFQQNWSLGDKLRPPQTLTTVNAVILWKFERKQRNFTILRWFD